MIKIIFTNKCNVPSWMPEDKKKFRENANEYFRNALEQVPFFEGYNLEVTYFLQGVGSIVAKIVTNTNDIYVMKTTESINHTNAEICTYKAATDNNVKVPKLFYNGIQDSLPFFLIEYFKEETFSEKLDHKKTTIYEVADIKANFFCNLKRIEGKGYCWPIKYENNVLQGNFETIDEFMGIWFCKKDFIDTANKYFPEIPWEKNLYYYVNKVKEQNTNNVCKLGTFDFSNGHIFASNPPTLFDPCLKLEPEYFDLAQLIIPFIDTKERDTVLNKAIFSKYTTELGSIDFDKLLTAVWLQSYRKATNLLLHTDEKRTANGLNILKVISNTDSLTKHIETYLV